MTRGKEAAKAANRRNDAALQHIDRLTSELTTAKIRMRDAEARAASAELRVHRSETKIAADAADMQAVNEYLDIHRRHIKDHRRMWRDGAQKDLVRLMSDAIPIKRATEADFIEFMLKRYPDLCAWLGWGEHQIIRPRHVKGLDESATRRIGRALGQRMILAWDPERDASEVMSDMLDVAGMELTIDEATELLDNGPGRVPDQSTRPLRQVRNG